MHGKRLEEAVQKVKNVARDGDVILIDEKYPLSKPLMKIGCGIIRQCQRRLFGEKSSWRDTHLIVYFSDGAFSAELPRATFRPFERFVLEPIAVYRYSKKEIDERDVSQMREAAEKMIGMKYSVGQLVNIMISQGMRSAFSNQVDFFGYTDRKLVCTIGAGRLYQKVTGGNNLPDLFSRLNESAWKEEFVERFERYGRGWDLKTIYPACFANSGSHFDGEFEKIAEFCDGKRIR